MILIRYDKLWALLKKQHMEIDKFLEYLHFDEVYSNKIKNGEPVTSVHLKKICSFLDVKLYEIIEFV